jgi:hypothetical protein
MYSIKVTRRGTIWVHKDGRAIARAGSVEEADKIVARRRAYDAHRDRQAELFRFQRALAELGLAREA